MSSKKTYIIWFIVLIAPSIISKIFYYVDYPIFNEDEANTLTVIGKIGLIVLTTWYALKIHFKKPWAILLGISTILPLMPWVSLIILLQKSRETKINKKDDTHEGKETNKVLYFILLFVLITLVGYLFYQFNSTIKFQNDNKEAGALLMDDGSATMGYAECINECDKTRVCLEFEKRSTKFVPGGPPPQCLKYSDTSQCHAICISKYK